MKHIPLTHGQTFHDWTVLARAESQQRRPFYLCRCKCGTEKAVCASHLTAGHSKSCGCTGMGAASHKTKDGVDEIALGLAVARLHLRKGEVPTHAFLAAFCGCSGERIRQIEERGLRKLYYALQREGVTREDLLAA